MLFISPIKTRFARLARAGIKFMLLERAHHTGSSFLTVLTTPITSSLIIQYYNSLILRHEAG